MSGTTVGVDGDTVGVALATVGRNGAIEDVPLDVEGMALTTVPVNGSPVGLVMSIAAPNESIAAVMTCTVTPAPNVEQNV